MKSRLIYLLFTMVLTVSCTNQEKIFFDEVSEFTVADDHSPVLLTEEMIHHLPGPVQRHIQLGGFIDHPTSGITEVLWADTRIKLGPDQNWRNLETRQYNITTTGSRLAYMHARMAGVIPFEGRDRYHQGQGHMLGTLGRFIRVFDVDNREVTLGGAVIVLAESLLEPSIALQDYITWEEADSLTARAVFHDGEISVSGIFRFNDAGEFIRFESNDRPFEMSSGVYELKPFSIDLGEYHETDGLRIPGRVQATWHLEEGDFTYWNGRITGLRRNVNRTPPFDPPLSITQLTIPSNKNSE